MFGAILLLHVGQGILQGGFEGAGDVDAVVSAFLTGADVLGIVLVSGFFVTCGTVCLLFFSSSTITVVLTICLYVVNTGSLDDITCFEYSSILLNI